ncbi:MAG: type II secretion system F family protein [Patescibacteria group bacterium]
MSLYKYLAKDAEGKAVSGEVESIDEASLIKILQQEKLTPIDVRKKGGKSLVSGFSFGGGVSYGELVGFTRQLSTMVSAGLPITDSLMILQRQTKSGTFAKVLSQVVTDVEGGLSLSQAMATHPKVFTVVYIKLIEAGETGGVLDKVLGKLAESLEKEREFKSKTKGAFIYPVIVVFVMVVVMTMMMIFVIPKLTSLYTEMGTQLPLITRILIGVSNFMRGFWWLIIIVIGGATFAFRTFAKTPQGADLISKVVLNLPVWGKMRKTLILAEFTRTLGLLIGTGIPIITALRVVRDILTNSTYRDGIDNAMTRVERGSPLHVPLAANPVFPPIIAQMIRVGEETGKMDEVLGRLALYFEQESENMVRNLTTALEPIILVVLGASVGVLVLSIIMPIYNLTAQF